MGSSSGTEHRGGVADELVLAARAGSAPAIDAVLALLSEKLEKPGRWRWRRRGSRSPCDLVHDALIVVRQKIVGFEGKTFNDLETWAWAIFHNLRCDANKTDFRKVRSDKAEKIWAVLASDNSVSGIEELEEESERAKEMSRVYAVYEAVVRPDERQIIELRLLGNMSWDAIGRMIRLKGDTARKKYERALTRLRELIFHGKF